MTHRDYLLALLSLANSLEDAGAVVDAERIRKVVREVRNLRRSKHRHVKGQRLLRAWTIQMMEKIDQALSVKGRGKRTYPKPPYVGVVRVR